MSRRFRMRFDAWWRTLEQDMKASVPAVRKFGIFGVVFVLVVYIINLITEQAIGNIVVSLWGFLRDIAEWIIVFSKDHLETVAVVALCIYIFILVTHAYFNTLPPHGVDVGAKVIESALGTSVNTGFSIINNSGNDLQNCKIYISEIDKEKLDRKNERDYLYWGERFLSIQENTINIPNTENGLIFINQIGYRMNKRMGNDKFIGKHELVLIFNADSMGGKKTLYIYCTIVADILEKTEVSEERPKITLLKVEK